MITTHKKKKKEKKVFQIMENVPLIKKYGQDNDNQNRQ